jgi:hypothetical protein
MTPKTSSPPPLQSLTIAQFCAAHNMCRASYYNLARCGSGPATIKIGRKTIITLEAVAAWRKKMEASAAEKGEQHAG